MENKQQIDLIYWLKQNKFINPTNETFCGNLIYEAKKENEENINSFLKIINERLVIRFI